MVQKRKVSTLRAKKQGHPAGAPKNGLSKKQTLEQFLRISQDSNWHSVLSMCQNFDEHVYTLDKNAKKRFSIAHLGLKNRILT
jgi:hypothetical protein